MCHQPLGLKPSSLAAIDVERPCLHCAMSLKLCVQTLGGSRCEVTPGGGWTAQELQHCIQTELRVPVAQQRLLYGGRALRDAELDAGALAALHSAGAGGDAPLELSLLVRSPAAAMMLTAVNIEGMFLQFAVEEFTQDKEIVMAAVEKCPFCCAVGCC